MTAETIPLHRKIETRSSGIFTEHEMEYLLNAVDLDTPLGLRDKAILELLYGTGIRAGELCNLRLRDVNETQETIAVIGGKGTRDRIIPAGETAMIYLKRYLKEARKNLKNAGTLPWLFLSAKGLQLQSSDVADVVQRHARSIGINRPVSARMIRNTTAAHLYYRGAPVSMIQQMLGLKISGMLRVYGRMALVDLREIYRKTHPGNGGFAA